ncbi:signal peptidase II [Pseudarthrobacter phenanthrenivorans]|nr:signal peptidase II [Pseudarthrobacter phenanthrenivorans]
MTGQARSARRLLAFSAAALAVLDLLVKFVVLQALGHGSHGSALDFGLLNVRVAYNTGVSFGLGASLPPWTVAAATAVLVVVLAVFLFRSAPQRTAPSRAGAALLLGGALGNLVDRLDGAGVVDYLHTGWFPTFNLADVFVVAGAGLLILGSVTGPAKKGT